MTIEFLGLMGKKVEAKGESGKTGVEDEVGREENLKKGRKFFIIDLIFFLYRKINICFGI